MRPMSATPITPAIDHVVTAREAIEPLYEQLEMQTDTKVIAAAVEAGWSSEDATKALAALRLHDAMATLGRAS
jgi:regulatory protein YycI of two-component signal transduction system YycFG